MTPARPDPNRTQGTMPDFDDEFAPTAAKPQPTPYRRGPHWFALVAAAFTWPLLFVGGLVTTYKVGMAVPDWPTTFGINMFLYDMTRAPWGVFGEHTHRLYGAAVGIGTILLMLDFLLFDRRRWIKVMGVVALLAVIGQGVLGGFRVRWNSTTLAAVHGTTAQAFFGFMVALCVWTSRSWLAGRRADVESRPGAAKVGRMAWTLLGLVYVQVLVGAWLRHYSRQDALGLARGPGRGGPGARPGDRRRRLASPRGLPRADAGRPGPSGWRSGRRSRSGWPRGGCSARSTGWPIRSSSSGR